MKKLIVAFRNFAKAPKTRATYSGPGSSSDRRAQGFPPSPSTAVAETSRDILGSNNNVGSNKPWKWCVCGLQDRQQIFLICVNKIKMYTVVYRDEILLYPEGKALLSLRKMPLH